MNKRKLYVICVAGLGNRLSPLISAIRLAKKHDYELVPIWDPQPVLPCKFSDIFQNDEWNVENSYRIPWQVSVGKLPHVKHIRSQYCDDVGYVAKFDKYDGDVLLDTYRFVLDRDEFVDPTRPIPFFSNDIPEPAMSELIECHQILRPIRSLQERIDSLEIEEDAIGVHVRKPEVLRQPGKGSCWWIPDKSVKRQMDQAIDRNIAQRFVFCCDCRPTRNRFLKRYGSRLLMNHDAVRPFIWDYSEKFEWCHFIKTTPEAIFDAYVDLISLSKTKYIIRNMQSTFSNYASFIGRSELSLR